MDSCTLFLIQCIIIHFCHHSFWCSNFPYFSQGDPLKQSPYPFNLCLSCWFSNTRDFLCFLTQEITSSLYSELAPVLEAAISPGSFSGESCLQTKNWMWLCFLLFRCHCFWALSLAEVDSLKNKKISSYQHSQFQFHNRVPPFLPHYILYLPSPYHEPKNINILPICSILKYTQISPITATIAIPLTAKIKFKISL